MLKPDSLKLSLEKPVHFYNERALGRGRKWFDWKEELSGLALFLQTGRGYKSVR